MSLSLELSLEELSLVEEEELEEEEEELATVLRFVPVAFDFRRRPVADCFPAPPPDATSAAGGASTKIRNK